MSAYNAFSKHILFFSSKSLNLLSSQAKLVDLVIQEKSWLRAVDKYTKFLSKFYTALCSIAL